MHSWDLNFYVTANGGGLCRGSFNAIWQKKWTCRRIYQYFIRCVRVNRIEWWMWVCSSYEMPYVKSTVHVLILILLFFAGIWSRREWIKELVSCFNTYALCLACSITELVCVYGGLSSEVGDSGLTIPELNNPVGTCVPRRVTPTLCSSNTCLSLLGGLPPRTCNPGHWHDVFPLSVSKESKEDFLYFRGFIP